MPLGTADGDTNRSKDKGGVKTSVVIIDGGGGGAESLLSVGQKAKAASIPVVVASDQDAVPVSAASLPLPTGAATAAKQPALGVAGTPSADVISVQGEASMTPIKTDGSATTQPVSAASLPLPIGAATAAKQPALGTAGSPSADIISVQGEPSMTPLKVDGSGVTQPVSASSLPLPTGAAQESGGNLATVAVAQGAQGTGLNPPAGGSGALGFLSGIFSKLSSLVTGTVLAAGSAIVGKFGVDQTTDGTTNAVASHTIDSSPAVTGTISAADSASTSTAVQNGQVLVTGAPTANSFVSLALNGKSSLLVQMTGSSWVGVTLVLEVSFDGGITWFSRGMHISGGNVKGVSTFTNYAAGMMNVAGVTNFRARATAYTSGTVTIVVAETQNSALAYVANPVHIGDGSTGSSNVATVNSSNQLLTKNASTTTTPNYFDEATPFWQAILGRNATAIRVTVDLTQAGGHGATVSQAAWEADLTFRLFRGGTTAISQGVQLDVYRMLNGPGGTPIRDLNKSLAFVSSTTAALASTVGTTSNSGQNVVTMAGSPAFVNGDKIAIWDSGNTTFGRLEFGEVDKVSGTTLTLKTPLVYTHTSGQADTVRNQTDFARVTVPGGYIYECVLSYGPQTTGDTIGIEAWIQAFLGSATQ
jgi:hypothetical protein